MTCALTTAGRIKDPIFKGSKRQETSRDPLSSEQCYLFILLPDVSINVRILLLSNLSIKFRISEYVYQFSLVFRRIILYRIFFLD